MSRNLDKSWQLVSGFSLGSSGLLAATPGGQVGAFAVIDMMGYNHLSVTFASAGTAVGNLTFECSDFGFNQQVYDPTQVFWAPLNQPNSTTQYSVAVASGTNNYNIQIANLGVKFIRIRYTSTSGTGTLNAAVTCRSSSR